MVSLDIQKSLGTFQDISKMAQAKVWLLNLPTSHL